MQFGISAPFRGPLANPEDIRAIAHPVLRHRLLTNFHADTEGVTVDDIIDMLLKEVRPPQETRAEQLLR